MGTVIRCSNSASERVLPIAKERRLSNVVQMKARIVIPEITARAHHICGKKRQHRSRSLAECPVKGSRRKRLQAIGIAGHEKIVIEAVKANYRSPR